MKIYWSKMTDSTNLDAFRNRENALDMTVWASEYQSAGKGQRGNKWESHAGENLTFSILFKPQHFAATRQHLISMIGALGVTDFLSDQGVNATIKWPNDIYVEDKKICGMLIENSLSGDKLSYSICGIGLNINQTLFPPELPNPTSLSLELAKRGGTDLLSVKDQLPLLVGKIESYYLLTGKEKIEERIEGEYLSRLYRLGEWHQWDETEYYTGGPVNRIEGRITGVEWNTFRLIVECRSGEVRKYFFKELRYVI